jgi:hypothetical protein
MTGMRLEISFDPGVLTLDEVRRMSAGIWSDLAFDDEARAQLRRDGLNLDGVRLTGPSPYRLELTADDQVQVSVDVGPDAETLIDLFRLHFLKGLRPVVWRPSAAKLASGSLNRG